MPPNAISIEALSPLPPINKPLKVSKDIAKSAIPDETADVAFVTIDEMLENKLEKPEPIELANLGIVCVKNPCNVINAI